MKEHPILFSGAMVRAILDGRKTQTRRVITPQPIVEPYRYGGMVVNWKDKISAPPNIASEALARFCPYGGVGDHLWVRETWGIRFYQYGLERTEGEQVVYRATDDIQMRWTPSIHMPRAYSRITLELTGVRVERAQDISEADAIAEGVDYIPEAPAAMNHRTAFAGLWNSINAARGYGWDVNPWVWVLEFQQVTP